MSIVHYRNGKPFNYSLGDVDISFIYQVSNLLYKISYLLYYISDINEIS